MGGATRWDLRYTNTQIHCEYQEIIIRNIEHTSQQTHIVRDITIYLPISQPLNVITTFANAELSEPIQNSK